MQGSVSEHKQLFPLTLGALGVVYGDIGTSPLYAMREALDGLVINTHNILGVLSLIFWSLICIVSIKYLIIIFKADNNGEGGILALLALIKRISGEKYKLFFLVGMLGAGLMLSDGMLTPAISVVSAIEGLKILSPNFSEIVLPLTCAVLFVLFYVQSFGTAKIGFSFGPIILLWFITIAILGIIHIADNFVVLKAINPYYGFNFLNQNGWKGYILLGGVFLAVTGGEALYADIGHFGKHPIRLGWFLVALPCLLLNYFGQGAYLLSHHAAIANPFYSIAPKWFFMPLFFIATMATIIASQAVITATFSLTKQAVLLGLYPHLPIVQTSAAKSGQIYIPQMNIFLATGTFIWVISFKNSSALTHAYGLAVNLEMVLLTIMTIYAARVVWQWSITRIIAVFLGILIIDFMFLGANAHKFLTGGWAPILFALVCAFIMFTWHKGMDYLRNAYYMKKHDLSKLLKQLQYKSINRLANTTAIFITDIYDKSGGSFFYFLKLTRTMPEHAIILSYLIENIPYVAIENRFEIQPIGKDIYQLTLRYGFMDDINIPKALLFASRNKIIPFTIDINTLTYLVEVPNILATPEKDTLFFFWQEKLFTFLMRNYSTNINIDFYQLPYNRTIAIGSYFII